MMRRRLQTRRDRIGTHNVRITEYLHYCWIMGGEKFLRKKADRVPSKIRRNISDAQPPMRVRIVRREMFGKRLPCAPRRVFAEHNVRLILEVEMRIKAIVGGIG